LTVDLPLRQTINPAIAVRPAAGASTRPYLVICLTPSKQSKHFTHFPEIQLKHMSHKLGPIDDDLTRCRASRHTERLEDQKMSATTKYDWMPKASLSRPQVVAVHGSASTGGQWRRLVDELSSAFDIVTPDLPGYGRQQDSLTTGSPTLAGDAIEIARIAEQASAPIHIVAHSYGAAVAVKFAINRPHRVASLTLIEPVLFHLLRSGEALDMAHYTEISAVANAVRMTNLFGVPSYGMSRFVDYWNGAGSWPAMKSSLRQALAGQSSQVARNFEAAFAETWSAAALRNLRCPTLIIAGQDSRGPAKRVAQIVFQAMPQARLKTIPGAGHMVPVTHPHITNSLIAEALAVANPGCNEASHLEAA
jgi:pimeloyl-ACP methyl ester carboxylesterase